MTAWDTAVLTNRGGRAGNEDACDFALAGDSACWALADGLGGHRGGEVAARLAVAAALHSFRSRPDVDGQSLSEHFERAQQAILDGQGADALLAGMRSTLVLLLSDGRQALWGHVGDSRLYHLQGGRIRERTRDHSVVQALVDAGEVRPDQQARHEDRSRLTRTLGKAGEARLDVGAPVAVRPGDAFLLCSDGLWELVLDPEIELDLAAAPSAAQWLARLEARVRRALRPDSDNYTAVGVLMGPGSASHGS